MIFSLILVTIFPDVFLFEETNPSDFAIIALHLKLLQKRCETS